MQRLERYFSYGHFMVCDEAVAYPGVGWTEQHVKQGFARQNSTVSFATFLEFGTAQVSVVLGAHIPDGDYHRVIAVPFQVVSGVILVEGPEESDTEKIGVAIGHYRLVAAQTVIDESDENGRERIDLFLEARSSPLERSEILVADDKLDPSLPLLETAEPP